ncbi:unnamed protein product [Diamesa hyperborea]
MARRRYVVKQVRDHSHSSSSSSSSSESHEHNRNPDYNRDDYDRNDPYGTYNSNGRNNYDRNTKNDYNRNDNWLIKIFGKK